MGSSKRIRFLVVGENIHCTRVKMLAGGKAAIVYEEKGEERQLPLPPAFLEGADQEKRKVKHVAAAVWQGLNGEEAGRKAGTAYLQYLARTQEAEGAGYLDLNVDEFSTDIRERVRAMRWAAKVIQEASLLPLSIDSSNTEVLQAGLESCQPSKGKPMVNSVSLERAAVLSVARQHGAVVVAGATGESSMPSGTDEKVANLDRLMGMLRQAGFQDGEIFLDPLVFPVSVSPDNGIATLNAIRELRRRYGEEIHFAPGISNISFGMPGRKLLNQVFALLCVEQGADGGIVDPGQINEEILASLDTGGEAFSLARAFLTGEDAYGMEYISAVRAGRL